jgi:Icc-related predicted phosphoesterase
MAPSLTTNFPALHKDQDLMKRIGLFAVILLTFGIRLAAQVNPPEFKIDVPKAFHFIAFGDTRFTDPADTKAANPAVRKALVTAIADEKPAFISIGGDIVHNGNVEQDWQDYDKETAIWRSDRIPVFPALGNHDLHGDLSVCLPNYFKRYPELKDNRFYAVRAGTVLMLTLDSSLDELSGPQGEWMKSRLNSIPGDVAFVVIVLHHPPYSSSTNAKEFGGGHSVRPQEKALAAYLEAEQKTLKARIAVFSGHVHNYERHEHAGVTYFVTGGGGAHAYPIPRNPGDPFQNDKINYHYLKIEVDGQRMKVTMRRLELTDAGPIWTEPDAVTIKSPVNSAHLTIPRKIFSVLEI